LTPPDEEAGRGLELLAWMVAQGYLDVKLAVPVYPDGRPAHAPGLYHEKVGILTDAEGNRLARKRSSWWRRNPDRARWGVSRNSWRRWRSSGIPASLR
jgi:hypothetical protein